MAEDDEGREHVRFEEMALGHVLGGLPDEDASRFRTHLVECRDCRRRVAELRDIAAGLAATEREERRRAAVTTRIAQDGDGQPESDGNRRSRVRDAVSASGGYVAVAAGVLTLLGLLFWSFHLRTVSARHAQVVDRQSTVLRVLAAGRPLTVSTREEVRGLAAIDDEPCAPDTAADGACVGVSLVNVPSLDDGEVLAIWLLAGGEPVDGSSDQPNPIMVPAHQLPEDRRVPFAVARTGADTLVISVEDTEEGRLAPPTADGRRLVHVDLRRPGR